MTFPFRQNSFVGGELAPYLYARTDNSKYESGLRTMRNFFSMRHGGATQRPGTQYIATTQNGGSAVRLIPFIFNETGTGQSYLLEFGNQYIAFYQNGGVVISGGVPYTISTPYLQADLQDLKFIQSADIITIVHQNYPPRELKRLANTSWELDTITIGPTVSTPVLTSAVGGNTTPKQNYVITAIDALTGEESLISNAALSTVGGADATHGVVLSWPAISGVGSYRVYKTLGSAADSYGYIATTITNSYEDFGDTPDFSNSPPIFFNPFAGVATPIITSLFNLTATAINYTYIYAVTSIVGGVESAPIYLYSANPNPPSAINPPNNIRSANWSAVSGATGYNVYRNSVSGSPTLGLLMSAIVALNFSDDGSFSPNMSINPPSVPNLNPGVVGFVQQRRYFAATPTNPVGFWGSQPGRPKNFNTHSIQQDSDSIIGSISSAEVNSIQNILEQKFMLMLTAGSEIYVQGAGNGVVTPNAINASVQSNYGCSSLLPLRIADTVVFNQALGGFIRDLAFDFAVDGYRGNDVTVFSSHLFENFQIVDWAYQKIPDSIIWAVRDDGILLSCTYVREQQVLAWARHDFTNGTVENVCSIPENGKYAVYLSIKRVINGSTVRYIERLSSRLWTDVIGATYLDCFAAYDGTNQGSTVMHLEAGGPGFETGDTAYQQQLTLMASADFFTSGMVGDQIFISDADFSENSGNVVDPENDTGSSFALSIDGNQVRCTIISYVSPTQVMVTPNKAVPTSLQGVNVSTWARAVKTVTGLDYIAGEEVSVFADRFVVGSPLNQGLSTVYTVPADGSLTLDKCYSVIYVGLPMTADLETLDIENPIGETMLSRRKRQAKVGLYIYNTRSLFAGSENPDSNLDNTDNDPLFQLMELKTGINRQTYDQPPELETEQQFIQEVTRFNKNGRIFLRNVDPIPCTILAMAVFGEQPSPSPYVKV